MLRTKTISISGCCGTIGYALLQALADLPQYTEVLGIDNNESGLFALEQEFRGKFRFAFGDIRDEQRLTALFGGMDVVLHTAALKHVAPCELAPSEAIKTNILGVNNVITAARHAGVKRVLFTSSDKAVNPTNVMGTSKLMGERLMSSAQISGRRHETGIFFSTRFGNVLGSHGSVFPLFQQQIAKGGPVTLTDPDMTRFVMSTRDAVSLVLESLELAQGGEVFVSKMRALRIADLAAVMIDCLAPRYGLQPENIAVKSIGAKPGEKLYEELLTEEESYRSLQLANFYVILPAFRDLYGVEYTYEGAQPHEKGQTYRSHEQLWLSREEIAAYLRESGLLPDGEE